MRRGKTTGPLSESTQISTIIIYVQNLTLNKVIPKQRNHPNIVNKLIGKSSLKSKQVDEDLTQTCCINQVFLCCIKKTCCCNLFFLHKNHTAQEQDCLSSAAEKHHHGASNFCSRRKHPAASFSALKKKRCWLLRFVFE